MSNSKSKQNYQFVNISKASNHIVGNASVFDAVTELEVWNKPKTSITIDLEAAAYLSDESLTVSAFDQSVCDAVFTLASEGRQEFTAEMVCRSLTGNCRDKITKNLKSSVIKSLEKMRHIDIRIECTDLFRRKGLITEDDIMHCPEQKYFLTSYLLPLEVLCKVSAGNNKNYKTGYRLIKEPVLYTCARALGQIACIPVEMFESCKSVQDSEETIILKRYLFRRIISMQNPKSRLSSTKISYEWYDQKNKCEKGLYQVLGYDRTRYADWMKKSSAIRQTVKAILDCLVKDGFITGYTEERCGKQKITGIILDCRSGRRKIRGWLAENPGTVDGKSGDG